MEKQLENKIVSLDELISIVSNYKKDGKVVVQSHGIFDLIHPGIVKHLNSAKDEGDILVVTVIKDTDVRRGPGRPIFPEDMRAKNVASLSQIDYVCIVEDENSFSCVQKIKPDIFAKGEAYKKRDKKIHKKIFEEERNIYFDKVQIHETKGFSFSSSQIINQFLEMYSTDVKAFLKKFSEKYHFDKIVDMINSLEDMKVLLIGDGIIDEYHYCTSMGKSAKSPLVVQQYQNHEVFAGGAFAIANHIGGVCNNIKLVTLLGEKDSKEDFINSCLKPNVSHKYFYRNDSTTTIKKRYIDQYLNQKLFEVNYLNSSYINKELENEIITYLEEEIPKYDLVLTSDFGHGFISDPIIRTIEKHSKILAVNTQTNGANAGYNMITKYRDLHFICLDEPEVRWAAQNRYTNIEDVAKDLFEKINCDYLITTLGKSGSIGMTKAGDFNRTPIFSTKVLDTVGAGDAFFAFTALCIAKDMPLDFVSFVGNAVGALAVQIMCNKKPVEKFELLEFIHTILK